MKRNVSLAVVLLVWLAVAGGAPGGGSSAQCGRLPPTVEPERAGPGEAFFLSGGGFGGGCNDSNLPFEPEPPQKGVRIEMRQEGRTWHLATLDASGPPDYLVEATLEVPQDAEPGGALVVAANAEGVDPAEPLDVPFEVLTGGAPGADRGPDGTGSPEQEETVVASGDLAACAGGGGPVDIVAEGTVERVGAGPDSSLVKIRLGRVLAGDAAAGETVSVSTGSGTGVVPEDNVGFEEGARYRLRLQRQGGVYTTNICLGTERLE